MKFPLTGESEGFGFKILDPTGCTVYRERDGTRIVTQYPLPRPGERWGPWFDHPNPAPLLHEPIQGPEDLAYLCACGPGRWHVMRRLDFRYNKHGYPWFVHWRGLVDADEEKLGVVSLRLRLIDPLVLHRVLRPPFNWARTADLGHSSFQYAYLKGADLAESWARDADFQSADLTSANLYRAFLRGSSLNCTLLNQANLEAAELDYTYSAHASFQGANLFMASLVGANVLSANFSHAFAKRACFRQTDLTWAVFRACDLAEAEFTQCNGDEADFREASARGSYFPHCSLKSSSFVGADLRHARFVATSLHQADFQDANLRGATFKDVDLKHANFRAADLTGTDLSGADLYDAQFDKYTVGLESVLVNRSTILPNGKRPNRTGYLSEFYTV